jgi:hypothetical protein
LPVSGFIFGMGTMEGKNFEMCKQRWKKVPVANRIRTQPGQHKLRFGRPQNFKSMVTFQWALFG